MGITVAVSMFLCLVGYIMTISDSFLMTFQLYGAHAIDLEDITSPRSYVITGAMVLILPLCFLDQRRLAFTSFLSVLVNIYVFLLLGYFMVSSYAETNPSPPLPTPCLLGFGRGVVSMVTAMMQAVIIQMCVLPMYAELQDKTPRAFNGIMTKGFSGLFLLFATFSILGYWRWGAH